MPEYVIPTDKGVKQVHADTLEEAVAKLKAQGFTIDDKDIPHVDFPPYMGEALQRAKDEGYEYVCILFKHTKEYDDQGDAVRFSNAYATRVSCSESLALVAITDLQESIVESLESKGVVARKPARKGPRPSTN